MKIKYQNRLGFIIYYLTIIALLYITIFDVKYYSIKFILLFLIAMCTNLVNDSRIIKDASVEKNKVDKFNKINYDVNYEIYTIDKKLMGGSNVAAMGLFSQKIFIENEVQNSLSMNELISIIMHEVAHLKNRHVIKSFLFKYISAAIASYGFHMMMFYDNEIKYFIIILGICMVFLCNMYMKKVEYIADKYAIENGCNKNDLVQALNKINDLNKVEGNKVTITYDLHPRLEKRIKRIKNY